MRICLPVLELLSVELEFMVCMSELAGLESEGSVVLGIGRRRDKHLGLNLRQHHQTKFSSVLNRHVLDSTREKLIDLNFEE